MNLLLRHGVRHHVRHPLQTLLTVLGIAAGTALLVAMQLAQTAAEQAFDLGLRTVAGRATHVVDGGAAGLPVSTYRAVRAAFGGRGVAPSSQAIVRVAGRPQRTVLRLLGVDPLADAELRPWASTGGTAARDELPLGPLLTVPGAFVATAEVLARLGVQVGESLPVTLGGRPYAAVCVGILAAPPAVAAGLQDVLLCDLATVQEWTGRLDRVDRLDLRLPDQTAASHRLDELAALCGPGARIEPVGAGRGGLAQLAKGFRTNLQALSLMALLVGAFLVHETMRLSVAARRRSFGVLRALGARGRQLFAVVAAEAGLLGLVGGTLGALGGVLAAQVLVGPLVHTLNDHYATFELVALTIDPWVVAGGAGLAALVAVMAGLAPAWAASRVPPRDVWLSATARGARGWWRTLPWAVASAALGWWLLATVDGQVGRAHAGLAALLATVVAVVPPLFAGLGGLFALLVVRSGAFLRYVVRSTVAARGHLALPLAAMVLALATTVGIGTMVHSFRASVAEWLVGVLPADVYISVPSGHDDKFDATFTAPLLAALHGDPAVVAASTYHRTRLRVHGGTGAATIEVCGMAPSPKVLHGFGFVAGDDREGRAAFARGEGLWVSEPLAFRLGLVVGEPLRLDLPGGPAELPVVAIHRDYSNERGEVIAPADWLLPRFAVGTTALALEAGPGVEIERWVEHLRERAAAASDQAVLIQSNQQLRTASLEVFDRTFAVTSAMRILCLLVAFFGIYAAFASLQYERAAEIGLLRCLGARPRWIGGVVLGQTTVLGLLAGLLALPVGAGFGHLLAHVVNRVSFGWSLPQVSMPWAVAGEMLVLAVVAAIAAGVQPAVRFARMAPADGLREREA